MTHAAVSLARFLGARRVSVYGADFSYPAGKAYARGTYLYDYFWSDQIRVSPAESRFFAFVCGPTATPARREVRAGKVLYSTPVLDRYRDRFLGLMASIDAEVTLIPGSGQDLPRGGDRPRVSTPAAAEGAAAVKGPTPSGPPGRPWWKFLSEYSRSIEELPAFSAISPGPQRELWHTLLPVAARVVKEGHMPGAGALEEARRWTLERVGRLVRSPERALQDLQE